MTARRTAGTVLRLAALTLAVAVVLVVLTIAVAAAVFAG